MMNRLAKLFTLLPFTIATQTFAASPPSEAIEKQKIIKKGVVIQSYKPTVSKPAASDSGEPDYANYAPLAQAVLRGELNQIDALLNAGAQIQTRGSNGESLLELAAFRADPMIVQRLISAGADVSKMS
jgi:ankyrin repeat protein